MNFSITRYGTEYLELSCNKQELEKIIDEFIDRQSTASFSFKSLCDHIKYIAETNDYFIKEPNTRYTSIDLQPIAIRTITKLLWEKIWDKKLVIDFKPDQFFNQRGDFHFFALESDK